MKTTLKRRYNLSSIMCHAWKLWKSGKYDSFSVCLKTSWKIAKSKPSFDVFAKRAYKNYINVVKVALNYNEVQSEDCLSDAIIAISNVYDEINVHVCTVDTYFYRVLKNKIIDYQRLRAKNPSFVELDNAETKPAITDKKETFAILYRYINLLRPKYQRVLTLQLEGYSEIEISKMLDVPKGTVKGYIHRAKGELAEMFEKNNITASFMLS